MIQKLEMFSGLNWHLYIRYMNLTNTQNIMSKVLNINNSFRKKKRVNDSN